MGRIKLDMPEKYPYRTEVTVRIGDINYGSHLGNDALLSIVHEARVRFLKNSEYSEADIEGVGIIMADVVIIYKSEGFYGDILTVDVAVGDFSKCGCDIFYRIVNKETDKEVARVKTGIVFFDYVSRKVVAVPAKFRKMFAQTE